MIIDAHIHIGERDWCKKIIETSEYKDLYRIYSCIDPEVVSETSDFLKDVDKYFAIPLFFCESNIEKTNAYLLSKVKDDKKAVPILLVPNNDHLKELLLNLKYNILKEHFTLHNPDSYLGRADAYDYLSGENGYLLLHTFTKDIISHVKKLRENFPNMKIIIAHLGRDPKQSFDFTTNVINTFYNDQYVYTDISTITNPELIEYAVKKYGSSRVLYGSDFPFSTEIGTRSKDFISNVFKTNLTSSEYDDLFYKTADNIINTSKILKLTNNN